MLLAEANQWPADVRPYFGDGDECHMAFHFPLMPRMFMAVRQEDRHPIVEILRQTPDIPENCQWAMFLRNHDELTLEMVTDEERDYMYQAYAADPQMRINVGIRRRLAPLLENSRRRIELLHGLLFSMPGTPVVYYGDEIGMGDNIYLGDRNGVRTPMQWTGDRNAGFSRADPARLFAPPIMDPVYGYQAINVEAQERAPFSLLNWMKRMIGLRKQSHVFGRGTIEFLPADNRKILAYVRKYQDEEILCVANLSRSVQPVQLDLTRFKGRTPVEMLFVTEFPAIGDRPYFLTLPGYFFYWFRLEQAPTSITARVPPETPASVGEAPALFMGVAWDTLLDGNVRTLIERDLLAGFLQRQRWFGGKARGIRSARFVDWGLLRRGANPLFLTIVEVEYQDGERDSYFLPLAICAAGDVKTVEERWPQAVLARVTGARKGVLFDGWLDNGFARAMLESIEHSQEVRMRRGTVQAVQTAAFAGLRGDGPARHQPPGRRAEQYVAGLRRSLHPQAVQAPAAGDQPRLRDRAAADRTGGLSPRSRRHRSIRAPDDRRTADDHRDAAAARGKPGRRLEARDRRGRPLLRRGRGHGGAGGPDTDHGVGAAGVRGARVRSRCDGRVSRHRRNARAPDRRSASGAGQRFQQRRLRPRAVHAGRPDDVDRGCRRAGAPGAGDAQGDPAGPQAPR